MNRTNAFIRGFASTTAQKILTKLIGLIMTPIVLTYLDNSEYGIWIIIGSVLGYMGLMDFGVTGATSAIVAKSNTQKNEQRINVIINNAFALQCVIGIVIIILGLLFSSYFPSMFNLGEYSEEEAWLVFVMAIIGYGISFPPKSLKGLIRARQMISLAVWLEFGLFLLTTALNLYLLYVGFGLLSLPLGTIAIRLLSYPIFIMFARKAYPQLNFDPSLISLVEIRKIFGVSSLWFISMIAAMVIYSTDTIIIGMFMSTAMVTVYALTFRLSEVMRDWIYSINFTLMPGIGQIMGQGDTNKARDIYLRSQPLILSLAIVGAFLVYLFNGYFVSFWVGAEYYAGTTLSLIFAGLLFISVVFHASSLVISADLKLKAVMLIRITEAIINIVLSIWLVRSYGLTGIAIATLIAGLTTSFWAVPYLTMKHLNISFTQWFKKILFKLLGIFSICAGLAYLAQMFWSMGTTGVIISFFLYGGGSIMALWFIAMDQQTKKLVYAKFR